MPLNAAIRTVILSFSAMLLSSCFDSHQVADVEKVDETEAISKFLASAPAPIKVRDVKNGMSGDEIGQMLASKGYTVTTGTGSRPYFLVRGVHGSRINAVFQENTFETTLQATQSALYDVSPNQKDTSTEEISITMFGTNLASVYSKVKYSQKYSEGPNWYAIAPLLKTDWGLPDLAGFPDQITGRHEVTFSFNEAGAKAENGAITVAATISKCVSPRVKNDMFAKSLPADKAAYVNKVCGLDTVYVDNREGYWYRGILKILREDYVRKFGEPDCWMGDEGCVKLDNAMSTKIGEQLRTLMAKKYPGVRL